MRRAFVLFGALVALAGCASAPERQAAEARRQQLIATHIQLGVGYYQAGQYEAARENFNKVLSVDADNAQANNMLALIEFQLKNYDKAEQYFRRALAASEDDPELMNNFGVFLCERGKFDEAERWFKKAIAHPKYRYPEQANLNAGVCLLKKPAPAEAERYLRAALAINPQLAPALLHMARISYDSGRTLSARGFIQRYLEVARESPELLWLAYKIERALGNKNEAASYALKLKNRFPDSAEARELAQAGGAVTR
jgi:type IV pilus assembly protein PilF